MTRRRSTHPQRRTPPQRSTHLGFVVLVLQVHLCVSFGSTPAFGLNLEEQDSVGDVPVELCSCLSDYFIFDYYVFEKTFLCNKLL